MIARSRWIPTYACTLLAILFSASPIRAQGWVMLPNGEIGYITNYTTTGFFTCGDPLFSFGTCHAAGNSLTLGNGPNTMTMVFQGLSNQFIMANNAANQRFTLGTITKTFSGPGQFTFPSSWNVNVWLFGFSVAINSSYPIVASGGLGATYYPTSPTTLPQPPSGYSVFPVTQPPGHFTYSILIWENLSGATMTVTPELNVLTATAALAPEPAVIWLTASGCLALAPLLWRRRRKSLHDA